MSHWVTIDRYDHPTDHAVQVARLAHEGIPYRVVHGTKPSRRSADLLLKVRRRDAMMAAKLLGLPKPDLSPEPSLSGLGHALHRVLDPVLGFWHGAIAPRLGPGRLVLALLLLAVLLAVLLW